MYIHIFIRICILDRYLVPLRGIVSFSNREVRRISARINTLTNGAPSLRSLLFVTIQLCTSECTYFCARVCLCVYVCTCLYVCVCMSECTYRYNCVSSLYVTLKRGIQKRDKGCQSWGDETSKKRWRLERGWNRSWKKRIDREPSDRFGVPRTR